MKLMQCCRNGCTNDASRWPRVTFASVAKPDGPRACLDFKELVLCHEHASTDASDYIDDPGWARIVAAVKKMGRAYPDRKSLRVEFQPLVRLLH